MGKPCMACGATGFGSVGPSGYVDDGVPCARCNADATPRDPGSFAPKPARKATVTVVDDDVEVDPTEEGSSADAFFPAAQIEQQRVADAAAERRSR
jgi:hypothetical protein